MSERSATAPPARSRGWALGTRWLGVGLASCIASLTVWLWATGRIGLYINPGSAWWAVSMALLVLVGAVWSCIVRIEAPGAEHAHASRDEHATRPHIVYSDEHDRDRAPGALRSDDDDEPDAESDAVDVRASVGEPADAPVIPPRSRAEARAVAERAAALAHEQAQLAADEQRRREQQQPLRRSHDPETDAADRIPGRSAWASGVTAVGGVAASAFVVAGLVLPPAALSTELALARAAGAPPQLASSSTITLASSADTRGFGIGDWASLIATTTNPSSFVGTPVTLTGFVGHGRDGGFELTRLVIVHCVIDAQAASVPVTQTDPAAAVGQGQWVTITGVMASTSQGSLVLDAQTIAPIAAPSDPYEN